MAYYAKIEDAPLSDILRKARTMTDNQLVVFYYSVWQESPDTDRSTFSYIVFYQGVSIDHFTHVPGPFAQYGAEIEYNAACTEGMALSHFRIPNNDFLNKVPYVVL